MRDENLAIEELPSDAGQRVLRLTGPLVLNSFFAFQTLIREDQTATLVLDFTGVPYIDSAGIGAMVGAYVHRQKAGRNLLLVGVQPTGPHGVTGHESRAVLPLLRSIACRGRRFLEITARCYSVLRAWSGSTRTALDSRGRDSIERKKGRPFQGGLDWSAGSSFRFSIS